MAALLAQLSQLQGEWIKNKLFQGRWLFADGSEYRGAFVDNQPLGEGLFNFASGIAQEGEYIRNGVAQNDENEAPPQAFWKGRDVVNLPVV